jgi:glycosyltransferase involved in cell wall biosynthesis
LIVVNDIYRCLEREGHNVSFFGLAPIAGPSLVDRAGELPIRKRSATSNAYIRELATAIANRAHDIDIVHLHHLGYGMARALLALDLGVPKIAFVHGTDIYDAKTNPDSYNIASEIIRGVEVLLFPTVSLVRDAARVGLDMANVHVKVIPWGIPTFRRTGAMPARSDGVRRVIAAGRLTHNKDFETVVRAVAALPETFRLELVGSGELEGRLFDLAWELGAHERISFIPFMPRTELLAYAQDFDCAVFSSVDGEAFGLVGVEMQSVGIPLVRARIGVFDEVFGDSAAIFEPGDPSGLAVQIMAVCENEVLARDLRMCGHANSTRFELRSQVKCIERLSIDFLIGNRD